MFSLIGVAVLALATVSIPLTASAQVPTWSVQTYSTTNILPAAGGGTITWFNPASTNPAPYIDVSRSQVVTLQSIGSGGTAGATNVEVYAPTVDGVNFDTNVANCIVFSNACLASAYTNTAVKSFTVAGALGYKYIYSTVYANAGNWTNGAHQAGIKISSP